MSASLKEKHALLVVPKDCQATEYQLTTLPHCSKHNETTLCMIHQGKFLELQSATLSKHGSFLIHNRISSSNQLYLGSQFDPRFSLLPHFYNAREKYSPLPQILLPMTESKYTTEGCNQLFNEVTTNPKSFKLSDICDINDKYGDDMIFYRYNEDKVLAWLRSKVERVAQVISRQRSRKEQPNSLMASSFVMDASSHDTSKHTTTGGDCKCEVTIADKKVAIEIVCDCLNDLHTDLLINSYGFPASDVLPKQHQVKRKADWEIEVENEKESGVLSGFNSAKPSGSSALLTSSTTTAALAKTQKTTSKSEQANKNAAKGTANIMSFFGGGKK